MFPTKPKMVRAVNMLLVVLGLAPVLYIGTAALFSVERRGSAWDTGIVSLLFPALVAVSIANIGTMIYFQRRWRPVPGKPQFLLVNNTFLSAWMGGILSEAHSIYGLVLTILSGSILYEIGFSLTTWTSLLWVRSKFKQNLEKLPNE